MSGRDGVEDSSVNSKKESEIAKSCPTLHNPMDCSLPDSVHGIFQTRILEWVAISFSRGSCWPRDRTLVSRTAGRLFTIWAIREAHNLRKYCLKENCIYVVSSPRKILSWNLCREGIFLNIMYPNVSSDKELCNSVIFLSCNSIKLKVIHNTLWK